MKRTPVAGAIIENSAGLVLLAQRPEGKHLAGMWEFPGGKIEFNETPEAAIKRELKEELELDVRMEKYLGSFPYDYPRGAIDLHIFLVTSLGEPHATIEVPRFIWTERHKIAQFDLAPADIEPLKSYLALRPIH